MKSTKKSKSVLVVGAGIAGIQASLDLAEMGAEVHLVEETPSIGGRMPQLDKTFPTNDCSICILSPKMSECARHPGITLHTYSSLVSISGEPGHFVCRIVEHATFVDPEKCVSCGLCEEKCPVKVEDEFDVGLRKRKAIYRYFLQSIPSYYLIDAEHCLYHTKGVCKLCEKVCPAEAINYEDTDKEIDIECGAVILSSGIDPFNPIPFGRYGYKRYSNVVTSLEFERMLCASGPLRGHLVKPSNKETPKKIAFIQCVGSRDESINNNYCSSVCCMYAIKEAVIAKEHIKELQPYIFYMDIRAYGKDFDKYYEKAESQYGVKFIRSKVAEISELNNNNLRLKYTQENGKISYDDFDLVILSIGLQPRKDMRNLSEHLDIKLEEYGFCRSDTFTPLDTTKNGIFVCGAMNGPKDIPESVMSASGAAANAVKFLSLERQEKVSKKEFPPEKNVIGDRPRIGAFICHCGINIAGVVDVKEVVEYAKTLPNVEYSEDVLYACSQDCLNTIKQRIEEHNLNRVLVAACTPRTHEPLFRETIREAGLNQYLFEMANIRDQCSWAHMNEPLLATEKSKDLVKMGVAKARNLTPLQRLPIEINPKALVIGGGLSGMTAALSLATADYEVYLVEKEKELGGNLRDIYFQLEGKDPQKLLKDTIQQVKNNKFIHLYTDVQIKEIIGYVGNFKTSIFSNKKEYEFEHGIVIVATGAEEHKTEEYLYGKSKRIITQVEFEEMLNSQNFPAGRLKNVVMIQCVGSREQDRMYCSRVCCNQAIKNSIALKRIRQNTDIYMLYRDIRTYGLREKYYTQARDNGVIFLRYDLTRKPEVVLIEEENPESKLRIRTYDPILDKEIEIEADLLVLSVAMDPPEKNSNLAKMLKVPLNQDGFFLEAHVKLRPVDFATDGIFVCGLAHGPKDLDESIVQAKASAGRALTFLSKKAILAEGTIAQVNPDRCSGCGYCEEICAYAAIEVDLKEEVAVVNDALCKGCGACAASCRCGAIDLRGFSDEQLFSAFNTLKLAAID